MTSSTEHAPQIASFGIFRWLGSWTISFIRELGSIALFLGGGLVLTFTRPFKPFRIIQQVHFIGMKSLTIIGLTGLFTGMVLGLQGYYMLVQVQAEGMLGAAVALSLVRELGPVLTALMVTGRAGSSMAAELGIMRNSEQIDALDTMSINPLKYLVSPRLIGALISFPLLTAICNVVGIIGGYLTGVVLLGVDSGSYLSRMEAIVDLEDVTSGLYKSLVFAVIVATVCCYQGYTTHLRKGGFGARGVSNSTTSAVVLSCVLVLAADYVLSSFLI